MKIKGTCVLVASPKYKTKIPSHFKQEFFSLVVETGIKMCSEAYEQLPKAFEGAQRDHHYNSYLMISILILPFREENWWSIPVNLTNHSVCWKKKQPKCPQSLFFFWENMDEGIALRDEGHEGHRDFWMLQIRNMLPWQTWHRLCCDSTTATVEECQKHWKILVVSLENFSVLPLPHSSSSSYL